jgi:hypothetical protein
MGLPFAFFLTDDTVNALADLLGFFYLVFERVVPLIQLAAFGGQLGILRYKYYLTSQINTDAQHKNRLGTILAGQHPCLSSE